MGVTSKMCHEVVKMRKCVAVGEKMWEALKSFESENQINIDKLCDIRNHEKSQIRYSIESIDTSSENVKSAACLWPCHRHRHRASRIWQVRLKDKLEANEELRYGAFQRDSTKAEGEDMVVSYIKKKTIGIYQNTSEYVRLSYVKFNYYALLYAPCSYLYWYNLI